MTLPDILNTRIHPPIGLARKFLFYWKRYGFTHAFLSFFGRKSQSFWNYVGPLATRKYLRKALSTNNEVVLNLGGGGNTNEKYLTGDVDARADVYVDVTKRLPFPNNTISKIILEEVIEHLSLKEGRKLLRECCRILVPGGVIRIITPHLEYFSKIHYSNDDCDMINDLFYMHGHKYIYAKTKLETLVREAGLVELSCSEYQDSKSVLGGLDSHPYRFNHAPEISQYLEAKKETS